MIHTAGTWDPTDKQMLFIACGVVTGHFASHNRHRLIAVNELPEGSGDEYLERHIARGDAVFLDSGIFNLTMEHVRAHGCSMNEALGLAPEEIDGFAELKARYLSLIGKYGSRCWGYIEMDQGGRENKKKTRAELEGLGLRPIPVYHPLNDGWDYFDELAASYDRICLGNVVQADLRTRARIFRTIAERKRAYPHLWIHALGVSPCPLLWRVAMDSADASTWLWPIRWGKWPAYSSFERMADLSERFFYHRGSDRHAPHGEAGQVRLLGWDVAASELMWRHHTKRQFEECE